MYLISYRMQLTNSYSDIVDLLPKKWVVIRLSSLGDIVLTTGVITYWYTTFNWEFVVITQKKFTSIFENNPAVQTILGLTTEQLQPKNIFSCFLTIAKQYANYGLIDLHKKFTTRLLASLWRGPIYRYPKMDFERRIFLLTKGSIFKTRLNKWNVPQRYAKAIGIRPPEREKLIPSIVLRKEEINSIDHLVNFIPPSKKIVALHPYSLHENKAWYKDGWESLIKHFITENIAWFIIGQGVPLQGVPEKNDFTNKTSLRQTCALLKRASVLVTGDSGPMHLATAMKTPVIALCGPTTKDWGFFPLEGKNIILETNLPCRPCSLHGDKKCIINHNCMKNITFSEVLTAIEKILTLPAKDI